jgi:hypothetical protein
MPIIRWWKSISICCPTRKRPSQMQRLWDSIVSTVYKIEDIELVFYIDDDDIDSIEQFNKMKSEQIIAVIGKQKKIAECWNDCYELGNGEIFMLCADDIVFMSKGWDKLVRDKFDEYSDKILLVYGRDGGKNERLATHPFVSRKWIKLSGYFTPPYFVFQMCDKWLDEVARGIGRRVFIDAIYTEHRHCADVRFNPGGKPDDVWMNIYNRGQAENVRGIYHSKKTEREEQIEKLKKYIEDYKQ